MTSDKVLLGGVSAFVWGVSEYPCLLFGPELVVGFFPSSMYCFVSSG